MYAVTIRSGQCVFRKTKCSWSSSTVYWVVPCFVLHDFIICWQFLCRWYWTRLGYLLFCCSDQCSWSWVPSGWQSWCRIYSYWYHIIHIYGLVPDPYSLSPTCCSRWWSSWWCLTLSLCSCINGVELSDLLVAELGVSVPLTSQGWCGRLIVSPCWGVLVLGWLSDCSDDVRLTLMMKLPSVPIRVSTFLLLLLWGQQAHFLPVPSFEILGLFWSLLSVSALAPPWVVLMDLNMAYILDV